MITAPCPSGACKDRSPASNLHSAVVENALVDITQPTIPVDVGCAVNAVASRSGSARP